MGSEKRMMFYPFQYWMKAACIKEARSGTSHNSIREDEGIGQGNRN
jgi:hypothetical protein